MSCKPKLVKVNKSLLSFKKTCYNGTSFHSIEIKPSVEVSTIELNQKCPFCGNEILSDARVCMHCNRDVLYAVVVSSPAEDPKSAYSAAKEISRSGGSAAPDYKTLRKSLTKRGAEIASYVTRREADFFKSIASQYGIGLDTKLVEAASGDKNIFKYAPIVLGICALAAGLFLYIHFSPKSGDITKPQTKNYSSQSPSKRSKNMSQIKPLKEGNLPEGIKISVASIKKLVSASVVITDGRSLGSGFFVHPSGYILTNSHVVRHMSSPKVKLYGGNVLPARVIAQDPNLDLALIQVPITNAPTLKLGDATKLQQGDTVWTVGNPHGLAFTVTRGIVSYVGRKINGKAYIQSDVAINRGNSGGPMVNDAGEVVGVNTFIISGAEGLNFALPINYAIMGDNPILAPVLGKRPSNPTFAEWISSASSESIPVAVEEKPAPKFRPGGAAPQVSSRLLEIYKKDRNAATEFNSKKAALESEISILSIKKNRLESEYQNAMESKTISEETKLGKKLKKTTLKLLKKQEELYNLYLSYYDKRERFLSQIASMETDPARKVRAKAELSKLDGLRASTKEQLRSIQEEAKRVSETSY